MTLPPLPDPGPAQGSDPMLPTELPATAPGLADRRSRRGAGDAHGGHPTADRPVCRGSVPGPDDRSCRDGTGRDRGNGRPPVVRAPDPPAPRDPAVATTAHETASVRSEIKPSPTDQFSEVAARVGDEVITLHELRNAYAEYKSSHFPPGQSFAPAEKAQLVKLVLDNLIDRALTLQEAKRMMKNPKQWDKFKEFADKAWEEEELPPLLRKYAAANVYELRQKLAAKNKSLDTMREDFRVTKMSREFVHMKVWPKLKVDLTEMRDYYNDHLDDFDRTANITWREIVVETKAFPDRVQARRKAEELLDRLRHGEDFAKVAKAASQGPTASEGGLWNTTPGSYAVNAVNQALGTIPLKQVSPILEGPDSFHIIRVEGRREAGPAQFDEVQDEIRATLVEQTFQRETKALIDGLRAKTLVKTKLDDESADGGDDRPRVVPAAGAAEAGVSPRERAPLGLGSSPSQGSPCEGEPASLPRDRSRPSRRLLPVSPGRRVALHVAPASRYSPGQAGVAEVTSAARGTTIPERPAGSGRTHIHEHAHAAEVRLVRPPNRAEHGPPAGDDNPAEPPERGEACLGRHRPGAGLRGLRGPRPGRRPHRLDHAGRGDPPGPLPALLDDGRRHPDVGAGGAPTPAHRLRRGLLPRAALGGAAPGPRRRPPREAHAAGPVGPLRGAHAGSGAGHRLGPGAGDARLLGRGPVSGGGRGTRGGGACCRWSRRCSPTPRSPAATCRSPRRPSCP